MRTTLTIDDHVSALLKRENRRANESFKQTVNRVLLSGLTQTAHPVTLKPFVVQPIDTGLTPEQWAEWDGMKIEEILEAAERPITR